MKKENVEQQKKKNEEANHTSINAMKICEK